MRDPDRIPRICEKLKIAWMKSPDQRLGQFISNLVGPGFTITTDPGPVDIFCVEDDKWEKKLDNLYDNSY